jgi:hypothetical protein
MIKSVKSYFSPDSKSERIEKKFQKSHSNNILPSVISIFRNGLLYLLRVQKYELFSNLVTSHLSKILEVRVRNYYGSLIC